MRKIMFLMFFLSGCAMNGNKPLSDAERSLVKNAVVVSSLGDELLCTFTGLTIFTNESAKYKLDSSLNSSFSMKISESLNKAGVRARSLPRESIQYVDKDKGAGDWRNIKIDSKIFDDFRNASLIIFDGIYHYDSTGGYYARDNALKTSARLYIYDVASGRLLSKMFSYQSNLKRSFSCNENQMPSDDFMNELIERSGDQLQKELVEKTFYDKDVRTVH